MPFRFEGLEIWTLAREFSSQIDRVVSTFPKHELYGLRSQMSRAANAVPLLIAEGAGLSTRALFNHRLSLAVGETFEVAAAGFLALDRGYVTEEVHAQIYESADKDQQLSPYPDTTQHINSPSGQKQPISDTR